MSAQLQSVTCQRCGAGFILTPTYHDLLVRQGVEEIVPMLCPTCFLQGGPLPKESGEVKWFNPHKQYGFIKTDAGEEVFFHRKQLLVTDGSGPQAGQRVQFHLRFPVRGPEAVNVELGEG